MYTLQNSGKTGLTLELLTYLQNFRHVLLILLEKMVSSSSQDDFVVNISDIHYEGDIIAEVVLYHTSQDINGKIVPAWPNSLTTALFVSSILIAAGNLKKSISLSWGSIGMHIAARVLEPIRMPSTEHPFLVEPVETAWYTPYNPES